jgi:hypothetical protein
VIAFSSFVFWVFFNLIPEYCLTLMGDADMLGATEFGLFAALLSILPVIFLSPLAIFYWLQYLGRVLVASAMGETKPPRLPDRNFDGFLNGLRPWLIWSVLGLLTGLFPLIGYVLSLNTVADGSIVRALALVLLGLPYAVMALLMSFLHDDPLAATPWGVIDAIFRLGVRYGLRCLFVAAALVLSAAPFMVALRLRAAHFWLYVLACLGCWVVVDWILIVVMRVLGTYHFRHQQSLRWHRERPRWGVVWKL